jgi:hypothetical protein
MATKLEQDVIDAAQNYHAANDDGHVCGGKSGEWCSACLLKWALKQLKGAKMSEDEQCGRWETTPEDLKTEVKRLRTALEKARTHLLDSGMSSMEMSLALSAALTVISDALSAPGMKTD